jgi:hypothetical protein
MAHLLLNWEKLINKSQERLIDTFKYAFKNLYRYGNESSTYKILSYLQGIYENPSPHNLLIGMIICEKNACIQLFRNPYNTVGYEEQFMSWREACKLVLPKLRDSFRSYVVLQRYKDTIIYEARETCISVLLLAEKKSQLRNFGWVVCMFVGVHTEPWNNVILASRLANIRHIWERYSDQSKYLGKRNANKYDIDVNQFIF